MAPRRRFRGGGQPKASVAKDLRTKQNTHMLRQRLAELQAQAATYHPRPDDSSFFAQMYHEYTTEVEPGAEPFVPSPSRQEPVQFVNETGSPWAGHTFDGEPAQPTYQTIDSYGTSPRGETFATESGGGTTTGAYDRETGRDRTTTGAYEDSRDRTTTGAYDRETGRDRTTTGAYEDSRDRTTTGAYDRETGRDQRTSATFDQLSTSNWTAESRIHGDAQTGTSRGQTGAATRENAFALGSDVYGMQFTNCSRSDNTYPNLGGACGTYGTGTSGYGTSGVGAGGGTYDTGTSAYVTTTDPRNSRGSESRPEVPATMHWTRTEASRMPDASRWAASPGAKSLFAEALRVDKYPDMLSPATSIGDDGTVPVVAGGASTQRPWF